MKAAASLAAAVALAALGSCAAISSPQGGPRDKTPPRLIATSPDSAARNVKQQFIKLTFSEAVQVKDLPKNLLITPQLASDNQYQLRQDRTSVSLLFPKPLDPNTTYSFNFRKAIVDITESLPAKYEALSFSTGPTLDSARVRGTVTNLLTNHLAGDASVGLYRVADTAGVRRGQPYYLTRTDAKGNFELNFIKVGQYNLYAWTDKNNNGRFDDGESIAYLPGPIQLTDTTRARALLLTRPDRQPPRRTSVESTASQIRLHFNEGLRALTLTPVGGVGAPAPGTPGVQDAVLLGEGGHTVVLYKTTALADGRYLVAATDSADNTTRDTLNVRFPVPNAAAKKTPPNLTNVEGNPRAVFRQGQLRFRFPVPVVLAAGQPFGTLVEDSLKRRPLRLPTDGTLSPDRTQLTVTLDTKALKKIEINLDSTVITSITGQRLGLKPLRFTVSDIDPNGVLMGPIETKVAQFDLQLLDDKYQVVRQVRSPKGRYRFDRLPPGNYRFRVLIDRDGDGRWRGGDPALRLPPEPVYVSPTLVKLRANFELEDKLAF